MSASETKAKVRDGKRWGRWSYNAANDVIEDKEGWGYSISIQSLVGFGRPAHLVSALEEVRGNGH